MKYEVMNKFLSRKDTIKADLEKSTQTIFAFSCKDTIKADLEKSTQTIFAFKEIRFHNVENKGVLNLILDIINVMGYLGNIDALVSSFMVRYFRLYFLLYICI